MEKYILFDGLLDLNQAPLSATKSLLELLHVEYIEANSKQKDIGYNLSYYERYLDIFKPTLELARDENRAILAVENSSLLALKKANEKFQTNVEIKSVNDIILQNLNDDFVHYFDKFNTAIYYGSDDEQLSQDSLTEILQKTKAHEIVLQNRYKNDGYFLLDFDKKMALKMAGDILFDGFDNGCDFLIVNDIRSFYIFDNYQKDIAKRLKRPFSEYGMPILFISELLLMAYGKIKTEENFTNLHKVLPSFI